MRKQQFFTAMMFVLVAIFSSCARDDELFSLQNNSSKLISINVDVSDLSKIFPVNLSEYDLSVRAETKASFTSAKDAYHFHFNYDSLIEESGIRQKYFEDTKWIYTEFPFKSNGTIYASISPDKSTLADSLVAIKCAYMLVEHPIEPVEWMEYIVTMVPTKHYVLTHPDYTFLEKPSFSGVILYSNLEGEFISIYYITKEV